MDRVERRACFGGWQEVWEHPSETLNCTMRFGIYLPPHPEGAPVVYFLSGLTCTEQNAITKAGAQRYAAELGLILVMPDTSPRGDEVADDPAYDLGKGAGFYVNATQAPWAPHYRMYDYITDELPRVIAEHFPAGDGAAIMGHSMGGHGALIIGLRESARYRSVSAFAPIVAPSSVPWGEKALGAYLGPSRAAWREWDATALLTEHRAGPILIDQGLADPFLAEQLRPERFAKAAAENDQPCELRLHEGYDHSYYFIASFIGEHLAFHAKAFQNP